MTIEFGEFQFWMVVVASLLGFLHFGQVVPAIYFGFGMVIFIEVCRKIFERVTELVLR